MLLRKFYFCSDQVKNKLFSAYCNNNIIYICSLWVSYRKRCMRQFIVSYNNLFRILRSLPMRCSASAMFASSNQGSYKRQHIKFENIRGFFREHFREHFHDKMSTLTFCNANYKAFV